MKREDVINKWVAEYYIEYCTTRWDVKKFLVEFADAMRHLDQQEGGKPKHECTCNSNNYGYGFVKCYDCGKLKNISTSPTEPSPEGEGEKIMLCNATWYCEHQELATPKPSEVTEEVIEGLWKDYKKSSKLRFSDKIYFFSGAKSIASLMKGK